GESCAVTFLEKRSKRPAIFGAEPHLSQALIQLIPGQSQFGEIQAVAGEPDHGAFDLLVVGTGLILSEEGLCLLEVLFRERVGQSAASEAGVGRYTIGSTLIAEQQQQREERRGDRGVGPYPPVQRPLADASPRGCIRDDSGDIIDG